MGTAVPAALLSCPLRRCIDTDSAGEDVGSGGAHELVGPGAESSAERRSGQRSWALWSGHHAQLDRGWCLELAEPILQVLEIFFFSHYWDSEAGSSAEREWGGGWIFTGSRDVKQMESEWAGEERGWSGRH